MLHLIKSYNYVKVCMFAGLFPYQCIDTPTTI